MTLADTLPPAITMTFPPTVTHRLHQDVAAEYLQQAQDLSAHGQGYYLPLTNAAAVFAAVACLDPKGSCQFRALRVSNMAQTEWNPEPVAAFGASGASQTREGVQGLLWPIYSRDMPVARACLQFLVALATGKPTPELAIPKADSGLFEALKMGVVGPTALGLVHPHAIAEGVTGALVWVQRVTTELVDGEPQPPQPPQYLAVNLAVSLPELVANPAAHIKAPEGLEDLVACIVERLTKLRMRGRKAGVDPAVIVPDAKTKALTEMQQRAERAEAQAAEARLAVEQQARLYAEQLGTLSGVPIPAAAGYIAEMLGYLQPDAPFQQLADRMKAAHPELFASVVQALQSQPR